MGEHGDEGRREIEATIPGGSTEMATLRIAPTPAPGGAAGAPAASTGGGGRLDQTAAGGPPGEGDQAATRAGAGSAPPPKRAPEIPGYEIEGELGRGGMGVVYRARQALLNRPCALKMILAGAHASPEATLRFLAEAEAVARLQHLNVVQIHAIGEAGGLPFFELEYVAGGSLDRRLDGTPWRPRLAAELAGALARGIAEAHRLGIVHRDLKPANVLIADDGTPKIADFGLAKMIEGQSGLTATESILGTPSYMAPEQAEGHSRAVGPAADTYAIGAILYELITGRPPFRGASLLETLEQVKHAEPVPPSRLVPGMPRDLETICLKCLRKEPARRYESAGALADDLRRFVAGEPIRARPIGPFERAWRWGRRRPATAALLATIALLGAALTAGALLYAEQQQRIAARQTALADDRAALAAERAEAQRETAAKLRRAWLDQAASLQRARQPGYRAKVWDHLRGAAALGGPEADRDEIRERILSCLGDPIGLDPVDGAAIATAFDGRSRSDDRVAGVRTPDGRVMARLDSPSTTIRLVGDGEELGRIASPFAYVHDLDLDAGGTLLAAACNQGFAAWDLPGLAPRLRVRTGSVYGVAIDPDGRWLAVRHGTGAVELWSLRSHRPEAVYQLGMGLGAITFSADGRWLLVKSRGGEVTAAYALRDTPERIQLGGHDGGVPGLAFAPDGRTLASVSKDRTLRLWYARTGALRQIIAGLPGEGQCVAFSADGALVAVGDWAGAVSAYEVASGRLLSRVVPTGGATVWRLAFDPLGRFLAAVGRAGLALLPCERRPDSFRFGEPIRVDLPGEDLAIHPMGLGLAVARNRQGIYRLDLDLDLDGPARPARVVDRAGYSTLSLGFAPDGGALYFHDAAWGVGRYDWETSTSRGAVAPAIGRHLGFDPTGRLVASALDDGGILLNDLSDGRQVLRLPAGPIEAWCLAWGPDGRRLASGRPDGGLDLWDLDQVDARLAEFGFGTPPTGPPSIPEGTPASPPPPPPAEAVPPRDASAGPEDPRQEGIFLARRGDWDAALAAFRRAIDRTLGGSADDRDAHWNWYVVAALLLRAGDHEGYRQHCLAMLDRFGTTRSPEVADRTAKACLLAPDPVEPGGRPARLASMAAAQVDHPYLQYFLACEALSRYREGRLPEVFEALDRVEATNHHCRILGDLLRAMAEHRRGRDAEAARWLDRAIGAVDSRLPPPDAEDLGPSWFDDLLCRLLRGEAERLIRGAPDPPDGPIAR